MARILVIVLCLVLRAACQKHNKDVCHCAYPYGKMSGDATIDCDGATQCSVHLDIQPISLFDHDFDSLEINTNGYVTLNTPFSSDFPTSFERIMSESKRRLASRQGFAMLSPLWTDNSAVSSNVYYRVHDRLSLHNTPEEAKRAEVALLCAKKEVLANGVEQSFNPTWMVVVTWADMVPHKEHQSFYEKSNTFQLVLMADSIRYTSYVAYNYLETSWTTTGHIERSMIGYYVLKDGVVNSLTSPHSQTANAFRMADFSGNTDVCAKGKYFFDLSQSNFTRSSAPNYNAACLNWMIEEKKRARKIDYYYDWTEVCPCDKTQATSDIRFMPYARNGYHNCYVQRNPPRRSSQCCCYDNVTGALITRKDGSGGQTFYTHPSQGEAKHVADDISPKDWCCHKSRNCLAFYGFRPIVTCENYEPPVMTWSSGGVRWRTIDGLTFTFNGLGEYVFMTTSSGSFNLQVRTSRTNLDAAHGATAISAIAVTQHLSERLQVEMDPDGRHLQIFVGKANLTSWFFATDEETKYVSKMSLTKHSSNALIVAFQIGIAMKLTAFKSMLHVTIVVPDMLRNNTQGLLGTFNGNPSDDLTPPGNRSTPLPTRSTSEKEIFVKFGETWRIDCSKSLFLYHNDMTCDAYANHGFIPTFTDDFVNMTYEERTKIETVCGKDDKCMFDIATTGNLAAAVISTRTNIKNAVAAFELGNRRPVIKGPPSIRARVGEEVKYNVRVADRHDDTATLDAHDMPVNATWDTFTHELSWTPSDVEPVFIRFVATDTTGGTAEKVVTVLLCGCEASRGTCEYDRILPRQEKGASFLLVGCRCNPGWTGMTCTQDIDGCEDVPCHEDRNCTDLTPHEAETAHGVQFVCSSCADGYITQDGVCVFGVDIMHFDTSSDVDEVTSTDVVEEDGGEMAELNGASKTDEQKDECECIYPYAETAGDSVVDCKGAEQCYHHLDIPPLKIFNSSYDSIQINTNGYVTLNTPFSSNFPTSFERIMSESKRRLASRQGFAMLSPLWTDNSAVSSNVYYRVHDAYLPTNRDAEKASRDTAALLCAKKEALANGADASFKPTWMIVVTWDKMMPRKANSNKDKPYTFQLVLVSDPFTYTTYVVFNYVTPGWSSSSRRSMIGYYVMKDDVVNSVTLPYSQTADAFDMPDIHSNTDFCDKGKQYFTLSTPSRDNTALNYNAVCLAWMHADMKIHSSARFDERLMTPCPCDANQAASDLRFMRYEFIGQQKVTCYIERNPGERAVQSCCYDDVTSALNTRPDGSSGHAFYTHPREGVDKHLAYDIQPKHWCCDNSANCWIFYSTRAIGTCENYVSPTMAWSFGWSYWQTHDRQPFTFNGLGEFLLMATGNFVLQARTEVVRDDKGEETGTTAIVAVAAQEDDADRVHVELDNTGNGLMVYIGKDDITPWFSKAEDGQTKYASKLVVTKNAASSLIVAFTVGVVVRVDAHNKKLYVRTLATDMLRTKTTGLFAAYNGGGFTPPGSSAVGLHSEQAMFEKFNERWRVTCGDSLLLYHDGKTCESYAGKHFLPKFSDEVLAKLRLANRRKIAKYCNNERQCMAAIAVTGDWQTTNYARKMAAKNSGDLSNLRNRRPMISVTSPVHVTIGQSTNFTVYVTDPDGEHTTLEILRMPKDAVFNNATGVFSWTPRNADVVSIRFRAKDSQGGVAVKVVLVRLCRCQETRGRCVFDRALARQDKAADFLLVDCVCNQGWTGSSCTRDFNACDDLPCHEGGVCTDLTPEKEMASGIGYACSAAVMKWIPHGKCSVTCGVGWQFVKRDCGKLVKCANVGVAKCRMKECEA